jgi:hypothetical protein
MGRAVGVGTAGAGIGAGCSGGVTAGIFGSVAASAPVVAAGAAVDRG